MSLTSGSQIGPYEITGKLGEGGMGEVYRAHDKALGRDVALKVLPASFATDPERVARFEREARTLASLNHPLIAQVYGVERSPEGAALVMELVEGEDLAERIRRGALPLDEVVPIARQIAEALEAAHEAGIIHRDLKPANIKVRPDGTVKVLDFGLAKALDPAASGAQASHQVTQSPTITTPAMTMQGVILGTAAYMAPEQAKGRPATKRADLWALGCVLFEMLSGKRPFDGDDMTEVLAAVIKSEPDWSALPADLPPALGTLVRGCLEKDPRKRVADAAVVRYTLDHFADATHVARPAATQRLGWRVATAAAVGISALVGAAAWSTLALNRTETRPYRFSVVPSEELPLAQTASRDIAVSPDGRHIVYRTIVGDVAKLAVRDVNQSEVRLLDGTDGARDPFISPDGQWVGYFTPGVMRKVALNGGASVTVCNYTGASRGASWGGDRIVFATASNFSGLMSVPAAGGEPTTLTEPDFASGEVDHLFPWLAPDGSRVLFTTRTTTGGQSGLTIAALNIETRERTVIVRGGSQAEYLPTGVLVFVEAATLRAARFDLQRMELTSEPVPVLENVSASRLGAADYAVSGDGLLVYVVGIAETSIRRALVWVGQDGREDPLKIDGRAFADPRVGANDRQAMAEISDGSASDIWTLDTERGTVTRQTFESGEDETPAWMPDGKTVVYASTRAVAARAIYRRRTDGVGNEEALWTGQEHVHVETATPDGRSLIVSSTKAVGGEMDLLLLPLDGDRKLQPLIQTPFDEFGARLSPDGRAMAYVSRESGRDEVYVRTFPSLEGKTQISTSGGAQPVWSRRGGELYFVTPDAMMAASVESGPSLAVGPPRRLFENQYYLKGANHTGYDVAHDGRFLMVKEQAQSVGGSVNLQVVLNWFEELTARLK